MTEQLLDKFNSGEIIGLVAVGGGLIVGLACGILGILLGFYHQAQETRRAETLAALKQDMLNRGMSAEEIRTVLEAGPNSVGKKGSSHHPCRA
jgi:hypothetical protein